MSIRSLLSASALITFGMIIGRVLGLLREMLLAAQFGTGSTADMAIALLIIPDFVAAALIGTAVSAVLIPAFAKRNEEEISALLWQTLFVTTVIFTLIAILCAWIFSGNINSTALIIAFSSIPFAAATSTITAYLQQRGKFTVPAFANAIFNLVVLIALWLAPNNLVLLAIGIMVASLARLLAHFAAFSMAGGLSIKPSIGKWQINRALLTAYLHTTGSGICGILPLYAPYAVIATLGGSVAAFNYAFKLLLFPAILGQTIVQMAMLPWFVKIRTQDPLASPKIYSNSLQVAWAASLAIGLAVSLSGGHIAALCFGYGKMTAEDIKTVGALMAVGVWATPGMIISTVWQQMLYASEQTRQAFVANIVLAVAIFPLCAAGYLIAAELGVLAGYAISQLIPLYILSRMGRKIVSFPPMPSSDYLRIFVAVIIVFSLLAAIFKAINPAPLAGVVLAIIIGALTLAAGITQLKAFNWKRNQWLKILKP